jgi:hypothetical protein
MSEDKSSLCAAFHQVSGSGGSDQLANELRTPRRWAVLLHHRTTTAT